MNAPTSEDNGGASGAGDYVDLQVNGYAGVDFNSPALTAEELHAACARLDGDGVAGILATIVTDDVARMLACLRRLAAYRRRDPLVARLIRGLHVEGPFVSPLPGYVGAHPAAFVRPATIAIAGQLLDAGDGLVRLVTLAPEADAGATVTRWLSRQGIRVAAGHTDASRDALRQAIDAGLSLFTHLGNGCPRTLDRHDNIVQRALNLRDELTPCFIGDGIHIPYFALGNYLALAGETRTAIVTDAIAAAGLGPGRYPLGAQTVAVGDDGAAWADDGTHLVGSAATMPRMAAQLHAALGLSQATLRRLLVENPGRVLG